MTHRLIRCEVSTDLVELPSGAHIVDVEYHPRSQPPRPVAVLVCVPVNALDAGDIYSARGRPPADGTEAREDILWSIWLHGNWRSLTKNLTTDEKEIFADAVDNAGRRARAADTASSDEWTPVERWWRG